MSTARVSFRPTGATRSLAAAVAMAAALITLPALAQSEPDPAPLAGPKVHARDIPGVRSSFAPGAGDRRMQGRSVPHRAYVKLFRSMGDESTPAELRLTDEQTARARAIFKEYRQQIETYLRDQGQEIDKLRERPGTGGPRADRKPRQRQGSPEQRQQRRRLMRGAPPPDATHARLWSILTGPQRQFARGKLTEGGRGRQQANAERRGPARGPKEGPEAMQLNRRLAPPTPSPPGAKSRMDQIVRRIEELPPRARRRVLSRLEETLDRIEAETRPVDKPAPDMDDLDIPPADPDDPPV